jgi:hypothetical protein
LFKKWVRFKVYDIRETGYNPRVKRRLCEATLKAVSSDDKGKYATLGLNYTTAKNRVDIEGKWVLLSNHNLL